MAINLDEIRQLEQSSVEKGQKWLYSADFNIKYSKEEGSIKLKNTERIDRECEDIKYISENDGVTIILAHQGRYKNKNASHLDFIIPYLSEKLGKEIKYFPKNNTKAAIKFVQNLQAGDVAIMGNTRFHKGEEKNNLRLAKRFAKLVGKNGCAAIGGFGKAHRAHASNAGILQYLPGYATKSQIREMQLLENWSGKKEGLYSVAVLGGLKKEKITEGLVGFSKTYDLIIPAGIVLSTIYLVQGKKIGKSIVEDNGKRYDLHVKKILNSEYVSKICIPEKVVIAKQTDKGFESVKEISIDRGIPDDYMIVDSILPDSALKSLEKLESEKGRLVLAGTPGIYSAGFKNTADPIIEYMEKDDIDAIILGGDTVSELKFKGPSSTGGGSALSFVAHGTTAVYEALKTNKTKFT